MRHRCRDRTVEWRDRLKHTTIARVLLFIALPSAAAAPFVVSTAEPADKLMHRAMEIMERDMRAAPMTGNVERDFVAMMIPHHQGAIDMAKVLLLYGKDEELRNLAQQVITEQQTEINLMRAWHKRHAGISEPTHSH